MIGFDPRSRIRDGDRDDRRAVPGRPNDQVPRAGVRLPHGLQPIQHQIQHHLLELNAIAAHPRKSLGELDAHRDVANHRVALQEPRHFTHDLVQVERHALEVALLEQRAQPVDHRAGSFLVLDDVADDLRDLHEIHGLGREQTLRRLGVAQDRRQRLAQVVRERRGELSNGRDPADVRQLLSQPLRFEVDLPARERIGKNLRQQIELLRQLLRCGARRADGAEHESADDGSAHDQRDGEPGLHAVREIAPAVHGRFVRQLFDSGDADGIAAPQLFRQPRELVHVHPLLDRPGAHRPAVRQELDETPAIGAQELDHAVQAVSDLPIEVDGGQVAERGGQVGEQLLEAQALGERQVHALSLERARERLAQEPQPLHELVGPGAFAPNGSEGERAQYASARLKRNRHLRARARPLVAGAIDRCLLGKLFGPGEPDDLAALQSLRSPWELIGQHHSRRLAEALVGPCDAGPEPAAEVLVEIAAIDAQERDHVAQPGLERRVDSTGRDVDQPRGELREQRLEAQALLQQRRPRDLLTRRRRRGEQERDQAGRAREALQKQQRFARVCSNEGTESVQRPPDRDAGEHERGRRRLARSEAQGRPQERGERHEFERVGRRAVGEEIPEHGRLREHEHDRDQRRFEHLLPAPARRNVGAPEDQERSHDQDSGHVADQPRRPHRSQPGPIRESAERQAGNADRRAERRADDSTERRELEGVLRPVERPQTRGESPHEPGPGERFERVARGNANGHCDARARRCVDEKRAEQNRGPDAIAEQQNGGERDSGRRPYGRRVRLLEGQQKSELAGDDVGGGDAEERERSHLRTDRCLRSSRDAGTHGHRALSPAKRSLHPESYQVEHSRDSARTLVRMGPRSNMRARLPSVVYAPWLPGSAGISGVESCFSGTHARLPRYQQSHSFAPVNARTR